MSFNHRWGVSCALSVAHPPVSAQLSAPLSAPKRCPDEPLRGELRSGRNGSGVSWALTLITAGVTAAHRCPTGEGPHGKLR